jgi:hypothetical protein
MRWRQKLEEYEYDIEYTKGKDNTAADALSRVHAITLSQTSAPSTEVNHEEQFDNREKSDEIAKRLKITPNKSNFY